MSGSTARDLGRTLWRAAARAAAGAAARAAARIPDTRRNGGAGLSDGPGPTGVLRPAGDLRVSDDPRGLRRGRPIAVTFDGRPLPAHDGETVGAALLAADVRTLRETRFGGRPRGLLCGIGSCHDCLVDVDGGGPVRACLTPVTDGMRITTHRPGGPGFDPAAVDLRGIDEA